jgi:predicted nucleic acid-binding protein
VTWGVLYAFLRVTTHPRVFRSPWTASQAWGFIEALIASPFLGILTATERHADVVSEVIRELPHLSGNLMHDAKTATLMREHGIRRIYTRDTDFHRFPFVEPIDPVT